MLTGSWCLSSGVPAGGRAPAAAGPAPHRGPPAHRHAAAPLQSPAGEEAVRQDEGGGRLHPGTVQSFSSL